MKKQFFLLIVISCIVTNTSAQTKLAVVSTDVIFNTMPETLRADSLLAAYQKGLTETYQDQQNELNTALAKFVKDSAQMTPAVKEAKRKDLQERIQNLTGKEQQFNKALEEEKEKYLKPIREKMLKAIQDVAKESGYSHVAYRDQLIVFPAADDITDKVKKKLGIIR